MHLFLNRIFQPNVSAPTIRQTDNTNYATNYKGLTADTFVKSTEPAFKSKGGSKTKAGDKLKDLDNTTCPYSGVKMLSHRKMSQIEFRLNKCDNLSSGITELQPYRKCMQNLEGDVFTTLKAYEKKHPSATADKALQELYPDCLTKLRLEEFKVLDNIDSLSDKLEPTKAFNIRKVTTNARKQILDNQDGQIFKRKDLLTEILNVTKNSKDKEVVDEMWETANKLPKSATNFNAFVVKYAGRSQNEILARLLRPSVASIEHITPKSIKPDHTLANFMLASRDWNSDRGNISLPDYIKKHPNIPDNCQHYTNDIIREVKKGHLQNANWYPYMIKEKLYNESEGIVDINLDKYNISEEEAMQDAPLDIVEKYNEIKEANKSIRPKTSADKEPTMT